MDYFVVLIIFFINFLIGRGVLVLDFFNWWKLIWISKPLEIIMIVCLSYSALFFLRIILFGCMVVLEKYSWRFEGIMYLLVIGGIILAFVFFLLEVIVLGINFTKYKNYYKNCPFSLDNINDYECNKRGCFFYNTNINSRYKYQYLCTYNPFNEFNNDKCDNNLCELIKPNNIICTEAYNKLEDNNGEINNLTFLFNKFKNENKCNLFYCSRKDKPNNYPSIKDDNCQKN